MREDTAPGNSGDRTLCSNLWAAFQELWDGTLEEKVDSEIRGQIIGVQTEMQSFHFFFQKQLGVLVLMHTGNLSFTLQYTHVML